MDTVQCTRCRCNRTVTHFKVSKSGKRNKTCMQCSTGARKVADSPADKVADSPTIKSADESADNEMTNQSVFDIANTIDPEFITMLDHRITSIMGQIPMYMPKVDVDKFRASKKAEMLRAQVITAMDPKNIAATARRLVRCEYVLETIEEHLDDMKISHLQSATSESRHLKYYIEEQFEDGMAWDNYGQWRIDFHTPINEVHDNDKDPTMWDVLRRLRPCNMKPVWNF